MREWTSEMDSKNTTHISEQPNINCDTNMSHTEFDHLACSNKSNSQNLVPVARGDIQKRTYWFWHPSRWLVATWQCLINQTVYHQLSAWKWLKSCMKMHCSWDGCETNTCQFRPCPANSAWDPPQPDMIAVAEPMTINFWRHRKRRVYSRAFRVVGQCVRKL